MSHPTETLDPDVALMLRVQLDEAGAFDELMKVYRPRLFGRFYRQFRNRQEAEDLVQDVFLRIFRYRVSYRPRAKFASWLFHIARNVARNAIRTRLRRPLTPMALPELSFQACGRETEISSWQIERSEVAGKVRSAMAELTGPKRMAMELQCLAHSYSEIAAALEVTEKAAKGLLYRARNELRESLTPFIESLT